MATVQYDRDHSRRGSEEEFSGMQHYEDQFIWRAEEAEQRADETVRRRRRNESFDGGQERRPSCQRRP